MVVLFVCRQSILFYRHHSVQNFAASGGCSTEPVACAANSPGNHNTFLRFPALSLWCCRMMDSRRDARPIWRSASVKGVGGIIHGSTVCPLWNKKSRWPSLIHIKKTRSLITLKAEKMRAEEEDLDQRWANWSPGAACGTMNHIIRPTELSQ